RFVVRHRPDRSGPTRATIAYLMTLRRWRTLSVTVAIVVSLFAQVGDAVVSIEPVVVATAWLLGTLAAVAQFRARRPVEPARTTPRPLSDPPYDVYLRGLSSPATAVRPWHRIGAALWPRGAWPVRPDRTIPRPLIWTLVAVVILDVACFGATKAI